MITKIVFPLLAILFITGCQNKKASETIPLSVKATSSSISEKEKKDNKVSLKKYEKEGILLKGQVKLFDDRLNKIGELIIDEISKIQILEKSTAIYNIDKSNDYCLKSNFVKIRYKNKNYLVFGSDVYEINESQKLECSINSKNEKYSIFPITNFEMGASDEEGLTGCDDYSILLVFNQNSNKYSTITVPQDNENHSNQKFAALEHDDSLEEKIYNAQVKNDTLILGIKIGYQEGYGSYFLQTSFKDNFSKSKVTERKRFEEENVYNELK
ncbi:hypothetical protein GKZ90_0017300 [Flavobacterium sp. MC2016-06]|uniref:hypothetical protein n=1 Tax=Flavobacterium sp. MC2016-06 TaxID=2676308 RepID=UPI0012BA5968|nr:hypothetical protein [Flavobacterium sp. MC2016-06]MBU3861982.1 hypothetical protein [Flavobacterium sp. MC2016-06]